MTERRAEIIQAGVDLWREGGEPAVSARKIAAKVGMTHGGILYGFQSAKHLRDEVARTAVAQGDPGIIRQLIVAGHAAVSHMDQATRQAWLMGA